MDDIAAVLRELGPDLTVAEWAHYLKMGEADVRRAVDIHRLPVKDRRAILTPRSMDELDSLDMLREATSSELATHVGRSPKNINSRLRRLLRYELIEITRVHRRTPRKGRHFRLTMRGRCVLDGWRRRAEANR